MANEIQLTFEDNPAIGFAGMIADAGPVRVASGLSATRKLVNAVPSAVNTTVYTFDVTKVGGTIVHYSYTSDGSATVAEITAGLVALINAGTSGVIAVDNVTGFTVESTIDGPPGDFAYASSGAGTLTLSVLQVHDQTVPFGVMVCRDDTHPNKQAVRLPRASADVTSGRGLGIVLADFARVANGQAFVANTMIPVLEQGKVFVTVEEAVLKGDDVFVRFASGSGGSQLGAFRKSADSASAVALPRATFETDAAIGGLAVVKLNR